MAGVRMKFGFIPFPISIVDESADLSLGEYRLLGYLLRHQFRVKTEVMKISKDELLNGVFGANGDRRDKGCGITSQRDLKTAREALEARGWLSSETSTTGTSYYLRLADEDEVIESGDKMHPLSITGCKMHPEPGAKCTH